jgi:hypothetical protein
MPDQPQSDGDAVMTDSIARPHNRSDEELAMRRLIEPVLRRRWPTGRIVHELPLRYSEKRIDMATVTEREIIAVEIKSSRDTMSRLRGQIEGFLPVSARVIVALAPKWNVELPMKWSGDGRQGWSQYTEAQQIIRDLNRYPIETWTVCHEAERVTETEGQWHRDSVPWSYKMLDLLWVSELRAAVMAHAVPISPALPHDALVRACCDAMTGHEVVRAVCGALRARAFPWADEPISVPSQVRSDLFDAAPVETP